MGSVKITDNTMQIKNATAQKANIFLRLAADDVVNRSERRTPKKTGRLRADTLRQVLGLRGIVEWRKRYAARQEYKQHKNYTTPGTGPHYAEQGVSDMLKNVKTLARKAGLL